MVGPHFPVVLQSGVQVPAGQGVPSLRPLPSRFLVVVDLSLGENHRVKQVFLSAMNSLHLGTMKGGRTRPRGQEARSRGLKVHVLAFCRIFAVAVPGWQWDLSEKSWDLRGPGLVLRD